MLRIASRSLLGVTIVLVVACSGESSAPPAGLPIETAAPPAGPGTLLPPLPSVTTDTVPPTVPRGPTSDVAPTVTPGPPRPAADISRDGAAIASWMQDQVKNALDGNLDLTWNATRPPPEWFGINYPRPYAISRIELVTSQNPAGPTVHEVWIGNGPDMVMHTRLGPAPTSDRQTLTVPIEPARVASRVVIRTLASPSHVAWREVRVFGAPAEAAPPSIRVNLTPFLRTNVELPTGIVSARDGTGRLFILEQKGRVRVADATGALVQRPFLDIASRVSCCTERGLEGLAFPPGYGEKRYFYASYTHAGSASIPLGALVLSRFYVTADSNLADSAREEIVLVVPQPHEAHNGGRMEFSPRDGFLYLGLGDGGPGGGGDGRSQLLNTHLGKILRLDPESNRPTYAVPPGNPFVGAAGSLPEIWALGMRNPWGLAFDWTTGDLYLGDTGEAEWEEVSFQPGGSRGGENYGWPKIEGRQCYKAVTCDGSGFVPPVTEYHHVDGCALVGGAVARSPRYRQLTGAYIYADFCSGRVWALRNTGSWNAVLLAEAGFPISSLGRDESGNVYVADYGGGRVLLLEEP